MYTLCDFTCYSEFWQFSVSAEVFPSLFPHSRRTQMFSCSSKEDVQSSKRKNQRVRESVGESDTLTPSCQFARGPLLLHRPPPFTLWYLMFDFQTAKSKQGQETSPGMKDSGAGERGTGNRPGGGNVQTPEEVGSEWRWMVSPKQYVIQQKLQWRQRDLYKAG